MNFHSTSKLCLIAALLIVTNLALAEDVRWLKYPLPPGRAERIRMIALEGDTVWAMANNSVFYWDGDHWERPDGPSLRGGGYLSNLIGGGDRPLYCSQPGADQGIGHLYRLSDGRAARVADFHYDRSTAQPIFHVAKSGTVLHRLRQQIRILHEGVWTNVETPDGLSTVFEHDDSLFVCYPTARNILHFRNGTVVENVEMEIQPPAARQMLRLFQWGDSRVLAFQRGQPSVQCFELESGRSVDVVQLDNQLSDVSIDSGFTTRDGSVWLLGQPRRKRHRELYRISTDGAMDVAVSLEGTPYDDLGLRRTPRRFLESDDGTLWFGLPNAIVRFKDVKFQSFPLTTGFNLANCELLEDRAGTIYAINGGLYAWHRGSQPPRGLSAPIVPRAPGETIWRIPTEARTPFESAWLHDGMIYATGTRSPLLAIRVEDGSEVFRTTLEEEPSGLDGIPWLAHRDDSSLQFSNGKSIFDVNPTTGEIQQTLSISHDRRIAPLPIPGGYIVAPEYRAYSLAAVDDDGVGMWQRSLPGYLMARPVAGGELTVMQTRGSSYGGQTTVGIDAEDGSLLWRDRTDAYGTGIFIDETNHRIIESDNWLSPESTEAWVIGRSMDGSRQWHFREPEQRSSQPIVDEAACRTYCAFSGGKVVCLRIDNGHRIWEREFPENLSELGGTSSYFPSWSPHSLQDGLLLIVDRCATLHLLDPARGTRVSSIALSPLTDNGGNPPKLIASPWITDNKIIVAFDREIVAIELPSELRSSREQPRIAMNKCECQLRERNQRCVERFRPIRRLISRIRCR